METFFNQLKIGGLGPGALDSDWIPLFSRDCHLGVSLEYHQAPNHPFSSGWILFHPKRKQQKHMGVSKNRDPKNGWFIMDKKPIKIDDLEENPLYSENPTSKH